MKSTVQYSIKTSIKRILALGAPLLFGRLSHYSLQLSDSIMMGHFRDGGLELGALAVAGLFFWILNTLLWPLSIGLQAIVSRKAGAGDDSGLPQNLGHIFDHGIITSIIFSIIAFGISFTAGPVFRLLLSDGEIIELALDYIAVLRWALFPLGLQITITRFFSTVHKPKYSMLTSILMNSLNIFLNYIFIYGKSGLPEMGIRGAALGSLLSYWIGLILILAIALRKEHLNKYRYFRFRKINGRIIGNIIRISAPPALQNILAMLIMLLYESMVENIGAVYLAATHIVLSFYRINRTLVGGFSHSCAIIVGNELGADNEPGAKETVRAGYLIGAVIGSAVSAAAFFFPNQLASVFSHAGPALDSAALALRFFAPFFFIEIIGFTLETVFTGNGWGRFVLFSEFATNLIFVLCFTYMAIRFSESNIRLAWWGLGLYQLSYSALLHLGYKSEKWCRAKID